MIYDARQGSRTCRLHLAHAQHNALIIKHAAFQIWAYGHQGSSTTRRMVPHIPAGEHLPWSWNPLLCI